MKRSGKSTSSTRGGKRAKITVAADISNVVSMQVPIERSTDEAGLSQVSYTMEDGTVTYVYVESAMKERFHELLNKPTVSLQALKPSTQQQKNDGGDSIDVESVSSENEQSDSNHRKDDSGESTEVDSVSSENEQPIPICHSTLLPANPIQNEAADGDVLIVDGPTVNVTACQSSALIMPPIPSPTKTSGIVAHKTLSTQVKTVQNNLMLSEEIGSGNFPNPRSFKEKDGTRTESAAIKNILNNAASSATMMYLSSIHPIPMSDGSYSGTRRLSPPTSSVTNKNQGLPEPSSDCLMPNMYTTTEYPTTHQPFLYTTPQFSTTQRSTLYASLQHPAVQPPMNSTMTPIMTPGEMQPGAPLTLAAQATVTQNKGNDDNGQSTISVFNDDRDDTDLIPLASAEIQDMLYKVEENINKTHETEMKALREIKMFLESMMACFYAKPYSRRELSSAQSVCFLDITKNLVTHLLTTRGHKDSWRFIFQCMKTIMECYNKSVGLDKDESKIRANVCFDLLNECVKARVSVRDHTSTKVFAKTLEALAISLCYPKVAETTHTSYLRQKIDKDNITWLEDNVHSLKGIWETVPRWSDDTYETPMNMRTTYSVILMLMNRMDPQEIVINVKNGIWTVRTGSTPRITASLLTVLFQRRTNLCYGIDTSIDPTGIIKRITPYK